MKLSEQLRYAGKRLDGQEYRCVSKAADRLDELEGDGLEGRLDELKNEFYAYAGRTDSRIVELEKMTHDHKTIIDRVALVEADLSDLTAAHEDFVDNQYGPFATIRAGNWDTFLRLGNKKERMGFYKDCCSSCWPAVKDRIENKESE